MSDLFAWLQEQLKTNGFMAGGVITVLFGAVLAFCRRLPQQLWRATCSKLLVSATILENSPAYHWFERWFEQQPAGQRSRRVLVRSYICPENSGHGGAGDLNLCQPIAYGERTAAVYVFSPEPGVHWFRYRKTWIRLTHSEEKRGEGLAAHTQRQYRLVAWSVNRFILRELLEDIKSQVVPKQEPSTSMYISAYGDWRGPQARRRKQLADVILPADLKQQIMHDLQQFSQRKQWYLDRHIPYRRCLRLIGPPGTGKTSLIAAIAGELGRDLYQLNLNDPTLSDAQVRQLFLTLGPRALLVLEDFDGIFSGRTNVNEKSELSFQNLINMMDGLGSREDLITIMTTNKPEEMDPALLRAGRVDVTYTLDYATGSQAHELFLRFFPEAQAAADQFARQVYAAKTPYSMADLQGWLISHADCSAEVAAVMRNSDATLTSPHDKPGLFELAQID